jgi:hypothetical protein
MRRTPVIGGTAGPGTCCVRSGSSGQAFHHRHDQTRTTWVGSYAVTAPDPAGRSGHNDLRAVMIGDPDFSAGLLGPFLLKIRRQTAAESPAGTHHVLSPAGSGAERHWLRAGRWADRPRSARRCAAVRVGTAAARRSGQPGCYSLSSSPPLRRGRNHPRSLRLCPAA